MSEIGRPLHSSDLIGISERIKSTKARLIQRYLKARDVTLPFADAVAEAIGTITYDEAVEGIISFFADEMRKK